MRIAKIHRVHRFVAYSLIVGVGWLSPGCATLAHRHGGAVQASGASLECEGRGEVCPWLIGDAALLILGVIPGVVAFVVDFSTGAWEHDRDAVTTSHQAWLGDDA